MGASGWKSLTWLLLGPCPGIAAPGSFTAGLSCCTVPSSAGAVLPLLALLCSSGHGCAGIPCKKPGFSRRKRAPQKPGVARCCWQLRSGLPALMLDWLLLPTSPQSRSSQCRPVRLRMGLGTVADEFHCLLPPSHASFPHSLPFPIHCSPCRAHPVPEAAPGRGRDRSSKQQDPLFSPFCFIGAAEQRPDLERHHRCRGKGHAMNPVLPVPSSRSSPAREIRLLQISSSPGGSRDLCTRPNHDEGSWGMAPGEEGAGGGMVQGRRAGSRLSVVSLQI